MLGVAHEVAAILNREVKYPEISYESSSETASNYVQVNVEATDDNPLYIAKVMKMSRLLLLRYGCNHV